MTGIRQAFKLNGHEPKQNNRKITEKDTGFKSERGFHSYHQIFLFSQQDEHRLIDKRS